MYLLPTSNFILLSLNECSTIISFKREIIRSL